MDISISDENLVIKDGVLMKVNPNVEKITIPKCVRKIAYNAFEECPNLTDVEFEPGGECIELENLEQWQAGRITVYESPKGNSKVIDIIDNEIKKNRAKREKITQIEAVATKIVLTQFINQYNLRIDIYQEIISNLYSVLKTVLVVPIGDSGIEIALPHAEWTKRKNELPDLFSFISSHASVSELVQYCIKHDFEVLGRQARRYAVLSQEDMNGHKEDSMHILKRSQSVESYGSVTLIGDYAFAGCRSLQSVKIPNTVTSIGERAFGGCSSLQSVEIPDSVTSMFFDVFDGCSSLEKIIYDGTIEQWHKIER